MQALRSLARASVAAGRSSVRAFHASSAAASVPLTVGDCHVPGDGRIRTVTALPGHGCVGERSV
jgi:hypothetical protein